MYLARLLLVALCVYSTTATTYYVSTKLICRAVKISNGYYWPSKYTLFYHGRYVKYGCNRGYKLVGHSYSRCWYGKWKTIPKCVKADITPAPPTCDGTWTQFFDRDNPTVTGDYERLRDLLKAYPGKLCSHPTAIDARDVSSNRPYQYSRQIVHVSPTTGFYCVNKEQRNRQLCKDYKVRFCCPPSVTKKPCRPAKIDNGYFTPKYHLFRHGQEITYRCFRGYELRGEDELECKDGRWDPHTLPKCVQRDQEKQCRGPGEFEKGKAWPNKPHYSVNEKITFSCDDTYQLVGPKVVVCTRGGRWNNDFPVCRRQGCYPPEDFENGSFEPIQDVYQKDESLWFNCDENFALKGEKDIYCNENGQWSHPFPTCDELPTCGPLQVPDNGELDPDQDSYVIGTPVAFSCSEGYELVGEEVLVCLGEGGKFDGWSAEEPTCRKIRPNGCPKPKVPDNGILKPHQNLYKIGQEIWYECNRGFTLRGAADVTCRKDGTWSAPPPTCDRPSCKNRCDTYNTAKYSCQCGGSCKWKRNCCHDYIQVCH